MSKAMKYPHGPLSWIARPKDFSGDYNLGPYAEETVQRFVPGTKMATWDGKIFKYSRIITSSVASMGVFNDCNVVNIGVSGTQAVVAGAKTHVLTLDADSGYAGAGVAEDELAGAYITVGHAEGNEQTRCIMSNTAQAVSLPTTLELDFPWNKTLTDTTAWTEVVLNPYNYLNGQPGGGDGSWQGCMGVAVVDSTALQYCWIQTYGPIYMTGTGTTSNAGFQRDAYVDGDGSVRDGSEITIETGYQRIGFVIDDSTHATAMPLVMLQISV